jgi:hypothetical protein
MKKPAARRVSFCPVVFASRALVPCFSPPHVCNAAIARMPLMPSKHAFHPSTKFFLATCAMHP